MTARRLAGGREAFYFEPPTWAKREDDPRGKCPVVNEALGSDLSKAIERGKILAAAFETWRSGTEEEPRAAEGTVSWLIAEYQRHEAYLSCSERTRKGYDRGLKLIENHELKSGRRFGTVDVCDITPDIAQRLYTRLKHRQEGKADPSTKTRASTASAAIRPIKAAWNAIWAKHHRIIPKDNPFDAVALEQTGIEVTAATYEQLTRFVAKADELGHHSIGDAAMIAFHWLQREVDIIGRLSWADYMPGQKVRIRHNKNRSLVWMPLTAIDENGDAVPLFPELEARLAERPRRSTLMIMRDQPDRWTGEFQAWGESWFQHTVAEIRDLAGLPSDVTFTTYRHGGFTEAGDAGATDQELMAGGGHKTRQTVTGYTKRTNHQAANMTVKRRAYRLRKG